MKRKKIYKLLICSVLALSMVGAFSASAITTEQGDFSPADIFNFEYMKFELAFRGSSLLQNTRKTIYLLEDDIGIGAGNTSGYSFFTEYSTYDYRRNEFNGAYVSSTYKLWMKYCQFTFGMPRDQYSEGTRVFMNLDLYQWYGADFNSVWIDLKWISSATDTLHTVSVVPKTLFSDQYDSGHIFTIDYTYPLDCYSCQLFITFGRNTNDGWGILDSWNQDVSDASFIMAFNNVTYDDLIPLPGLNITGDSFSDLKEYEEYNFQLLNDYFYLHNQQDTKTYVRSLFNNGFVTDTPFKNAFLAVGNVFQNVFVSTGLDSVFYVFLGLGIGFLFLFIVPSVVQSIRGFVRSRHKKGR